VSGPGPDGRRPRRPPQPGRHLGRDRGTDRDGHPAGHPEPLAVRGYRRLAELLVGGELDPDRIRDMASVFGSLWAEARGRPAARIRLALRDVAGLWRIRRGAWSRHASDTTNLDGRDVMGEMGRDLKIGLRVLFRSPVATLAAVVTLALGIGGTTAVFSVAHGVLFDPMDFPEADRLVLALEENTDGSLGLISFDNYVDLRSEAGTFESLALWRGISVAVTGLGEPERIRGEFVTATYFDVLRGRPLLGRIIRPGEDVTGGERVAVLAYGYWQRRFGSDSEIVGKAVNFNNLLHTIVGVMPEGFRSYWDGTEAWISLQTAPGELSRGAKSFFGIGRLAEGADLAAAEAEVDRLMARLAEAYPEANEGRSANLRPLSAWVVGEQTRSLVWALLGAVALVLLIATANVANLQLARASQRTREMAIRTALGGGRLRLLAQLLVENVALALMGGVLGVGVAVLILRVLAADGASPFAGFDVELNGAALGVAALLTLGSGTLAGLLPALRGSAVRPAGHLREDGRSGSEGRRSGRFRSGLVVAQMAMAVTLLVGASLLLRTAAALRGIEVGFDAENVLTGETRLTAQSYQDEDNRRAYMEQVVARLGEIPGVRGATLIYGMPFSGDGGSIPVRAEGSDLEWDQVLVASTPAVAEGYFDFMGIPVLAGRGFQASDGPGAEFALVASRSLAERVYPGEDAVGRMLETPEGAARIVGVVEDTKSSLSTEVEPTLYVSYRQSPPSLFSVLIRTEGRPESFERSLKEAFWSVDANQPLWEIMSLAQRMAGYSSQERFFSILLGGFAGLALLLAAVGMYGVMAYAVGRRRHELGVRLALGAERGRILVMVLRQGVGLTVVGAVVGLGAAAAGSRYLASVLFGVEPLDAVSFIVAPTVLLLVAGLATWIPARRATRVDPVEAFRA